MLGMAFYVLLQEASTGPRLFCRSSMPRLLLFRRGRRSPGLILRSIPTAVNGAPLPAGNATMDHPHPIGGTLGRVVCHRRGATVGTHLGNLTLRSKRAGSCPQGTFVNTDDWTEFE